MVTQTPASAPDDSGKPKPSETADRPGELPEILRRAATAPGAYRLGLQSGATFGFDRAVIRAGKWITLVGRTNGENPVNCTAEIRLDQITWIQNTSEEHTDIMATKD